MSEDVNVLYLALLALFLVLSAFFSGSEAAFLSAQRVKVRHMVSSGVRGAQRMASMTEHPERLLATVLLGNNLVNTAAAALGTAVALALLDESGTAILASTAGVTVLVLVLGEMVPKTVAARHPERLALALALPVLWVERLLFPLTMALQRLSRGVASLVGGGVSQRALITEEEIKVLISLGREVGAVERGEEEMLHKVFRFGERQAQEVMTPRTEIVWVEQGTTLEEFLKVYAEHYHTRFPVYHESLENVVGVLSVKDVLRAMAREEQGFADPVTPLAAPAYFVPETKLVGELFAEMRERRTQLAMVADEFGGVAGLITLKQLTEEIVGRVGEEAAQDEFQTIDEHTLQVDGGMRVDEANEKLDLNLPEGEYETLAGFLLARLGHIPQEGEHVDHDGLRLEVTQMRGVKIEKVTVTRRGHQLPGEAR